MLTTLSILLAACVLAILAIAMAYVLGWANRAFHVEVDPKVEAIQDALPGANCGGCGYVGCSDYAEAVAAGDAEATLCAPGGAGTAQALAEIMGMEIGESLPYRAVMHCTARRDNRLLRTEYRGEPSCTAANLVAGIQGCTYGCLGMGDCARACGYDAIHVIDGLATIDYAKCVGCKACSRSCPRNLISMVPFKAEKMFVIGCSNKDLGNDAKAVCDMGCIGCKACTKVNPDLFSMDGNVPVFNYDGYEPDADLLPVLDKCPRESLIFVGRPTAKDLAAVADEEVPDRIEGDFKTTVDETEWRG